MEALRGFTVSEWQAGLAATRPGQRVADYLLKPGEDLAGAAGSWLFSEGSSSSTTSTLWARREAGVPAALELAALEGHAFF